MRLADGVPDHELVALTVPAGRLRRVIALLNEIQTDLANDVHEHEGMPLTGPVVAEYIGTIAGTVAALANTVLALVDEPRPIP